MWFTCVGIACGGGVILYVRRTCVGVVCGGAVLSWGCCVTAVGFWLCFLLSIRCHPYVVCVSKPVAWR